MRAFSCPTLLRQQSQAHGYRTALRHLVVPRAKAKPCANRSKGKFMHISTPTTLSCNMLSRRDEATTQEHGACMRTPAVAIAARHGILAEVKAILRHRVLLASCTARRNLSRSIPGEQAIKHAVGCAVLASRPAWRQINIPSG